MRYSVSVGKDDKVYIHYIGQSTEDLARLLVKEVYEAGGIPFVHYTEPRLQREVLLHATKEQLELMAQIDSAEMDQMDCYIGIRGSDNASELSDVPRRTWPCTTSITIRRCIWSAGWPTPRG